VTGASFGSLGSVQGVDLPLLPLCDNLGTYTFAPIAAEAYAEAADSRWYPFGAFISIDEYNANQSEFYNEVFEVRQNTEIPPRYLDIWGNITESPSAYIIPAGRYYPQFRDGENRDFFPNERRTQNPNPSEGFADTFANIVLQTPALAVDSPRYTYFNEQHVSDWVSTIAAYND